MINYRTSCHGKQKHNSFGKAEAAIRSLEKRGKDTTLMRPYQCIYCQQFHVGHKMGSSKK